MCNQEMKLSTIEAVSHFLVGKTISEIVYSIGSSHIMLELDDRHRVSFPDQFEVFTEDLREEIGLIIHAVDFDEVSESLIIDTDLTMTFFNSTNLQLRGALEDHPLLVTTIPEI